MIIVRICCRCPEGKNEMGRSENGDGQAGEAQTHGYCRFHYLQECMENSVATSAEKREYYALLAGRE